MSSLLTTGTDATPTNRLTSTVTSTTSTPSYSITASPTSSSSGSPSLARPISSASSTLESTATTQNHPEPTTTTTNTALSTIWLQNPVNRSAVRMSATSSLTTSVVVTMAAPDGTSYYKTSLPSQPLETQIYQNTEPTTTIESEPVATVAPEIPERIVHRLTIDLGACAGFTLPWLQLIAGELGDLVAIGAGKFEVELGPDPELNYFGLGVSLKDDGARCGSEGDPSCVAISITTGGNFGLDISVIRSGGYSKAMYPFNIWLKDGVVWDTHPANSPEEAYHCWGWGGDECPYTFKNGGGTGSADWTLSSENPAGDVHIDFCPTDGPIWSSILPNPSPESSGPTHQSTYVILPTQTTVSTSTFTRPFLEATKPSVLTITKEADCDQPLGCISYSTYFFEESITSYRSTFITPLPWTTKYGETKVIPDAPTTVLETTFFATPPPTTTPSMLGAITITSTEPPSVQGVRPSSTLTELGGPLCLPHHTMSRFLLSLSLHQPPMPSTPLPPGLHG
ncbi:hypothetical protein RSOLAG1IB_03116 [Rhizoctonia solani AG-1 IB]|uniref:Uncharacterized protein n=1 Tax=Thanatephorus cucumeris (strain AG1-IB / isolate 7/3/14) TaxID=1108050 RepID=A0A0B7FL03_THACB|nr:hypothetical protein RSOLAG1IB_03116 [Rhizoctonia solani AG-1 IB]